MVFTKELLRLLFWCKSTITNTRYLGGNDSRLRIEKTTISHRLLKGIKTMSAPRECDSSCFNIATWPMGPKSHDQWDFSDQNNMLKICISSIMLQLNDIPKAAIWMKLGGSGEHEALLPFVYTCHLSNKTTTKYIYKAFR